MAAKEQPLALVPAPASPDSPGQKRLNKTIGQLRRAEYKIRQLEAERTQLKAATEMLVERLADAKADAAFTKRENGQLKLALAKSEAAQRELEAGLGRALDLAERYRKLRPIVPNLDRYPEKK